MKIGYVIRLSGVRNSYAYGLSFRLARMFFTREAARADKRANGAHRSEKIFQVELTKNGMPKRIIKKVR